jgi:hypothetical protein
MTTKDYEIIAACIANVDDGMIGACIENVDDGMEPETAYEQGRHEALVSLTKELATALAIDNPNFHRATFFRAALGKLPSEVGT